MLNKDKIPKNNPNLDTLLKRQFDTVNSNNVQQKVISKKMDVIDDTIGEKIKTGFTVSDYYNLLWTNSGGNKDMSKEDKENIVKKVESIQKWRGKQIVKGEVKLTNEQSNIDKVLEAEHFQLTDFEEFNIQEKLKGIVGSNFEFEHRLNTNHTDIHMMKALSRAQMDPEIKEIFHFSIGQIADDEEKKKKKEAKKLIEKLSKERKNLEDQRKMHEDLASQKEKEDLEFLKKKLAEEESKKKEEKIKKIEEKLKEFKENEEKRKKDKEEWDEIKKNRPKPLFEKAREEEIEHKRKESAERKERLKKIKELHKPLDKNDFKMWESEYQTKLEKLSTKNKNKEEFVYHKPSYQSSYHQSILQELRARKTEEEEFERKKELRFKQMNYVSDGSVFTPSYQSGLHDQIAQELAQVRNQKEDYLEKAKEQKSKIRSVDSEIRGKFLPKIVHYDVNSSANIEKIRSAMEDPTLSRKIGEEYLREVKTSIEKMPKHDKSKDISKLDSPVEPSKNRKDYLNEIRKAGLLKSQSDSIEKILKDPTLKPKDKEVLLRAENEKIEERLKKIQSLKKISTHQTAEERKRYNPGGNNTDDENDNMDDMYIKSIKAKLQILGDRN